MTAEPIPAAVTASASPVTARGDGGERAMLSRGSPARPIHGQAFVHE